MEKLKITRKSPSPAERVGERAIKLVPSHKIKYHGVVNLLIETAYPQNHSSHLPANRWFAGRWDLLGYNDILSIDRPLRGVDTISDCHCELAKTTERSELGEANPEILLLRRE